MVSKTDVKSEVELIDDEELAERVLCVVLNPDEFSDETIVSAGAECNKRGLDSIAEYCRLLVA